ncbi:MAG TPA: hypothetical protein VKU01_21045 [Bryobacteraceae bacterium]|nr:hypothetical protein [Bryobacteraceae bacterium]
MRFARRPLDARLFSSHAGLLFGGAAVVGMFFWLAYPGLAFYFTDDDIMNIRRAWSIPVSRLIIDSLTFNPQAYRPIGLLWYRGMFGLFGLTPGPFHWFCFALIVANLYLLYSLVKVLSGSPGAGVLAALLGCFHAQMDALYFTSAQAYDILCCTAYFLCLYLYVSRRQSGRPVGLSGAAYITVLFFLGLNSKEMAAALPIVLICYELIYFTGSLRERTRHLALPFALAVTAGIFAYRKTTGDALLTRGYSPQYTFERALSNVQEYLGQLLYLGHPLTRSITLLVLLGLFITLLAVRNKAARFLLLFVLVSPLPILFVEARGLAALYIPVMASAATLAFMTTLLTTKVFGETSSLRTVSTFIVLGALLGVAHYRERRHHFDLTWGKGPLGCKNTLHAAIPSCQIPRRYS